MNCRARYPLSMVRGDTYRKRIQIRSKATTKPSNLTGWIARVDGAGQQYWIRPFDVTGWTFAAQIRENADSTTVLATIAVTVIDAATGVVELLIAAATTATLPLFTGRRPVWDLQATKSDGDLWTPIGGQVLVDPDATRP